MRIKRLPPTEPSPSPSAPPRSGSTRRPTLAGVPLLLTALLIAGDVEAQRAGVGFAVSSFRTSSANQSSLWFGVAPGFYGSHAFSSGVGLTFGTAPRYSGYFSIPAARPYRAKRFHRGWRGRGNPHRYGHGYGYWGDDCWDVLWDPWYSYWPDCAPAWGWYPYGGYAYNPVYQAAYWPPAGHGWSFGIHLSFGNHWGYDRYGWRAYDPWYGWDPYIWYSPYPTWRTVYVDPGPRWVVSPRVGRGRLSPRIASGGWVSQTGYKENPRASTAQGRTAIARPSRSGEPAARSATIGETGDERASRSRAAPTRAARGGTSARPTPRREASASRTPETRGSRARPSAPSSTRGTPRTVVPDRTAAGREESTANGARRPTVMRGPSSRARPSATEGRRDGTPRPTTRPTAPSNRSMARPSNPDRRSAPSSRGSSAQRRAPTRGATPGAAPSRPSSTRSSPPRTAPSRSRATRSSPQRASPSRSSASRSSGRASRSPAPRAPSRASPAPQRSRPVASPSRSGGGSRRSSPGSAPRGAVRR